MKTILLLEDDKVLSETLQELLKLEDYDVEVVEDGKEALDATYQNRYDLYIFDVNVAYIDGFELLKSLRESGDETPALFITALHDIASLSKGFAVGADDYLKKPFDFEELLIRIQVLLRKSYKSYSSRINVEAFSFDIEKNELYHNGAFVKLAPIELALTQLFFKYKDQTILKEELLDNLSFSKEMSASALRVHINKLRKIGLPIETIKGVGYRLSTV